jgi:hypothetical protein
MAYKMKGFSGFKSSPAKQGVIWGPKGHERMMDAFGNETLTEKRRRQKKYRKPGESKFQSDVRRNKEQSAYEKGLPKANAEFYKRRKQAEIKNAIEVELQERKKKKSPAKQEGPIPKKNIKLQKGEMEGTWIYPGDNKNERVIDYEDRVEFAKSDAESSEGKEREQHLANAKKLQHEADIIRNRKPNKK